MPVITPRLTGHNARRGSGIIGARWRKNEGGKPGIRDSNQHVVRFPRFARARLDRAPSTHSNGLKPSAPPHCVASSRNKAVCAFRLVPRPRGWGCDGSLPSTKRIIAASRHFARRVASRESPSPRRLTWGVWRRAVAALAHWVRRRSAVAFATRSLNHDVVIFTRLWEIPN